MVPSISHECNVIKSEAIFPFIAEICSKNLRMHYTTSISKYFCDWMLRLWCSALLECWNSYLFTFSIAIVCFYFWKLYCLLFSFLLILGWTRLCIKLCITFVYWIQDGKIEAEVKLTGILSLGALQPGETRKYGTTIAPGLYAPVHQHFFVARMDMAVDCRPGEPFNQVCSHKFVRHFPLYCVYL